MEVEEVPSEGTPSCPRDGWQGEFRAGEGVLGGDTAQFVEGVAGRGGVEYSSLLNSSVTLWRVRAVFRKRRTPDGRWSSCPRAMMTRQGRTVGRRVWMPRRAEWAIGMAVRVSMASVTAKSTCVARTFATSGWERAVAKTWYWNREGTHRIACSFTWRGAVQLRMSWRRLTTLGTLEMRRRWIASSVGALPQHGGEGACA